MDAVRRKKFLLDSPVEHAIESLILEGNAVADPIRRLRARLSELPDSWILDVPFKVEVPGWSNDKLFKLRVWLTQRGQPVNAADGRPIRYDIPLVEPYDIDRRDADFKDTFRARIKKDDITDRKRLKVEAQLLDPSGTPVGRAEDDSVRVRDLDRDRYTLDELKTTDRDALVVVLPGILGADAYQRQIVETLEGRGTAAQIWDWTEHPAVRWPILSLRDRASVNTHTDGVAKLFAENVVKWKGLNPDKALDLLCGSGGASISLLSAKYLPQSQVFRTVVYASAAVSITRDLNPLLSRTGSLFNYYSYRDYVLVGIKPTYFGLAIKFNIGWPAAGRFGYRPNYPNWNPAKIQQLGWIEDDRKLENSGSHLDCYDEDFFDEHLLPLFLGNTPDRWTSSVLPTYDQPDAPTPP